MKKSLLPTYRRIPKKIRRNIRRRFFGAYKSIQEPNENKGKNPEEESKEGSKKQQFGLLSSTLEFYDDLVSLSEKLGFVLPANRKEKLKEELTRISARLPGSVYVPMTSTLPILIYKGASRQNQVLLCGFDCDFGNPGFSNKGKMPFFCSFGSGQARRA